MSHQDSFSKRYSLREETYFNEVDQILLGNLRTALELQELVGRKNDREHTITLANSQCNIDFEGSLLEAVRSGRTS